MATLAVQRAAEALAGEPARPGQPAFRRARRTMRARGRARALRRSIALVASNSTPTHRCRDKLHVSRKVYGSPRSTAFLAHGFRIAVHRVTGEIRILQSVQAYRRRQDHQPHAGAGTSRGRDRPGDRDDLVRADGDRRLRRRRESHLPELPHPGLRRHPPIRESSSPIPTTVMVPSARSRWARLPSFPSAPPWVTRSPTRRAFASTACPSAPTGFLHAWPK